jgi:hypothetical protein|tara:strand:+ start:675 stop:935 length:261 start_codon:yes stop_codon:yes gene_type:complete
MKHDFGIFEKVSLQEMCINDSLYSDTETEKSDKDDEQYLSDEEFQNKYSFLETFQKIKMPKNAPKISKKPKEVKPKIVLKEDYESD